MIENVQFLIRTLRYKMVWYKKFAVKTTTTIVDLKRTEDGCYAREQYCDSKFTTYGVAFGSNYLLATLLQFTRRD